jgi:hypothetical protein
MSACNGGRDCEFRSPLIKEKLWCLLDEYNDHTTKAKEIAKK